MQNVVSCALHCNGVTLMLRAWVQLESLKATTDTKEVSFKIAYGLPLAEMLRWGLYISGAVCVSSAVMTPVMCCTQLTR